MSNTKHQLKAADLTRRHLGKMVSVRQWDTTTTGLLSGVSHVAALIEERKIGQEVPDYSLGPTATTLTFSHGGAWKVDGEAEVEFLEPQAPRHSMHEDGEWFYACEACSGLADGDRQ